MTLQQLRGPHRGCRARRLPAGGAGAGLSQAGLTKSIAKLEKDHGVALLDRSGQGAALTNEGVVFLRYAKSIVLEANRAEAWLTSFGEARVERIALGVSIEPSLHLVPAVLADFRRMLPEVSLLLTHGVSSTLLADVRENRLEFAVTLLPPDLDARDLSMQVLFESESVIAARTGHPLCSAASIADLVACDWIVVGDPAQPADQDPSIRELFLEQSLEQPRIAAVTDSFFGAVAMLVESNCLTRLPRVALDHPLIQGKLASIETVLVSRPYQIAIVRKASRRLSHEAQTLCAMLASFARVAPTLPQR